MLSFSSSSCPGVSWSFASCTWRSHPREKISLVLHKTWPQYYTNKNDSDLINMYLNRHNTYINHFDKTTRKNMVDFFLPSFLHFLPFPPSCVPTSARVSSGRSCAVPQWDVPSGPAQPSARRWRRECLRGSRPFGAASGKCL